jgi:CRISPR system Cascade subunit CasB
MAEKHDENTATTKDTIKKSEAHKRAEKLLKFLSDRSEDRGIMADLRCALVDGKRHRAWPYLGYVGGIGDKYTERSVQTIVGLYATHPKTTEEGDFGAMCRKLLGDEERKKLDTAEGVGPITRRFQHLLAAEGEEIFDRVVRFVIRAKAEEIPVNYMELFEKLSYWQWPESADRVRADWARSFWTPRIEEEEPEE